MLSLTAYCNCEAQSENMILEAFSSGKEKESYISNQHLDDSINNAVFEFTAYAGEK